MNRSLRISKGSSKAQLRKAEKKPNNRIQPTRSASLRARLMRPVGPQSISAYRGRNQNACPMTAIITPERPDPTDARALIAELEAQLDPFYPRESRHGYSVEKLLAEAVTFFVIRQNATPAGCGGLKLFGTAYGEVKRMYVRPQFRGLGLAKLMLNHLVDYAQGQGLGLLRLETGIHQRAAIGLYEQMGFQRIPPFGEYQTDPLSRFYEKQISLKLT